MRLTLQVFAIILLGFISATHVDAQTAIECPASQLELKNVDFTANDCKEIDIQSYVMTSKSVWINLPLVIPDDLMKSQNPIGLFISGRASSRVYVTAINIGENGRSSIEATGEIIGDFDWVGYVPRSIINNKTNQLTLHISSFNAPREGFGPFNWLYVDAYRAPTTFYLKHYMPTLIPLGAMLLSLIYIIRRTLLEPKSKSLLYLLTLTVTATLQLLVEVFRGFYAYPYPWHDYRLDLIWFLMMLFGLALFTQCLNQFTRLKKRYPIISCLMLIVVFRFVILDPDLRTTYALLVPVIMAVGFIAYERFRDKEAQYLPLAILLAFASLIYIAPYNFLDVYLYYCIAALLAYLFTYEAHSKVQQQNELLLEKQRAEKLQLALELKVQEDTEQTITLKDSGKMIRVKVEHILFCQGAGDYVEVRLTNKTILHSGSLSGMTEQLPSYFIKVHRSYLVNAKHISHMRRLPAGTGEIELSNKHIIPVSRRLLPQLKEALITE